MKWITSRNFMVFLILFTGILKVLYLVLFNPQLFAWEDHDIAINLVKSGRFFIWQDGIVNNTFQFPVYPFLVSIIYQLFGIHLIGALMLNTVLYACTGFVMIELIKSLFQFIESKGKLVQHKAIITTISIFIFSIYPPTNYYSLVNVHPFTLNMLLFFWSLTCMFRYLLVPSKQNLILFSIITGLAILNRATAVVVFILLMFFVFKKKLPKEFLKIFFISTAFIFLIILPWFIRNYKTDNIIGLTSTTGCFLWKGSFPGSEGSNYMESGKNFYSALNKDELAILPKLNVREQNNFFFEKWKKETENYPGHVLKMYLVKLKNFWWFRSRVGSELSFFIQSNLFYYKIFYALIIISVIAGGLRFRRQLSPLFIALILYSMLQSVFFVESRHRVLIEPILIFICVLTISEFYCQSRKAKV